LQLPIPNVNYLSAIGQRPSVNQLLSTAICQLSSVYKPIDTTRLRKAVVAELEKQPKGIFAVAFKDLSTGQQFFINEHDNFHAASTMKTPVLIETYRQAAEKKFSLSDSITVHTNFTSIYDGSAYSLDSGVDSEKDLYLRVGTKLPLSDLLFRMITKSSNLSTNIIIELVGAKNVMKTMKTMGANDIRVLRGVEDDKAFQNGMNNTVTAFDLMLIFDQLANGKAVGKKASDDMIDILTHQHFRDVIPAKLPPGLKVANKSGSITGICHDSGIVFLPDGRKYVVVLLSRGIEDQAVSTETLATVSKIIYDHMQH
jgi:beta-lactamase class A